MSHPVDNTSKIRVGFGVCTLGEGDKGYDPDKVRQPGAVATSLYQTAMNTEKVPNVYWDTGMKYGDCGYEISTFRDVNPKMTVGEYWQISRYDGFEQTVSRADLLMHMIASNPELRGLEKYVSAVQVTEGQSGPNVKQPVSAVMIDSSFIEAMATAMPMTLFSFEAKEGNHIGYSPTVEGAAMAFVRGLSLGEIQSSEVRAVLDSMSAESRVDEDTDVLRLYR